MKLSRAFKSNHALFQQAVDENDTALMARLLHKEMDLAFVFNVHDPKNFAALRPEMAAFLSQHVDAAVEKTWDRHGLRRSGGNSILNIIFNSALQTHGDAVYARAFMTGGHLTLQQKAMGVLKHITSPDDRLDLFTQIITERAEKLKDAEEIIGQIRVQNLTRECDAFIAAGYAAHKDNEALLRTAAAYENRDFAKHLVTAHKADIDLAINTARFAGQDKVCDFLTGLRSETHPDAAPLQTFEEMAAELTTLRTSVKALEQTVAGLAAQMEALKNPVAKLDKPPLRQHHP